MLMPIILCGLLFIQLSSGELSNETFSSSCVGKWRSLPESTMCMYRDSPSAVQCGVSAADKETILRVHNELRARVSPPQRNMMKMYWNDDLAALAQKWAKQCSMAHDTFNNREVPGWSRANLVGQSWAAGGLYATWEKAIRMGWYSEVKYFSYGSSFHRGVVGHYTQLVRDFANLIGCGKCMCNGHPIYVCNYYRCNSRDTGRPYMSGTPCQDCPNKCTSEGLCDCGDRVCKNNGTLNTRTCQCDCLDRWYGDDCGYYNCPATDGRNCGPGKFYDPSKCKQWSNVPTLCPHMCGLCNGPRPTQGPRTSRGPRPTGEPPKGCVNSHARCEEWASKGECLVNSWMLENCKLACGTCTTESTRPSNPATPATTPIPGGCKDEHERCKEFADDGKCSNPWMQEKCKLACRLCLPGTTGASSTLPAATTPISTGCENKHAQCEEFANQGKCAEKWMQEECKLACRLCIPGTTGASSTMPAATTPISTGCENKHAQCEEFANQGKCAEKWMQEECKLACRLCSTSTGGPGPTLPVTPAPTTATTTPKGPVCEDSNFNCPLWARRGECTRNPWMLKNCQLSCNSCDTGTCEDLNDPNDCRKWAARGECVRHPTWMLKQCRRSCAVC